MASGTRGECLSRREIGRARRGAAATGVCMNAAALLRRVEADVAHGAIDAAARARARRRIDALLRAADPLTARRAAHLAQRLGRWF
jgi:hypothetical protein